MGKSSQIRAITKSQINNLQLPLLHTCSHYLTTQYLVQKILEDCYPAVMQWAAVQRVYLNVLFPKARPELMKV